MNDITEIKALLAGTGEAAETPEPVETETVETDLVEAEALQEEIPEGETAEAPGEEIPEGETAEAEDTELYTVSSLAAAIGWEASDLYDVAIPMADGEEPVTLGKIKDDYQALMREKQTMDTQIEELTVKANNVQDMTQQGQGVSQEMVEIFGEMDNIKNQYANINWDEEEKANPGQAALAKQKFQEAFNTAQGKLGQAQQKMAHYQQQTLHAAAGKMMELIPTWQDTAVRKVDQGKIRQVLLEVGYGEKIINGMRDPFAMQLLHELVGLREKVAGYETAGTAAVKQVRKAPKMIGNKRVGAKATTKNKINELTQAVRTARPGKRRGAELAAAKAVLGVS